MFIKMSRRFKVFSEGIKVRIIMKKIDNEIVMKTNKSFL